MQINNTIELPDTDGGTQLAKIMKEVNGENIISLEIMLGSGSAFQITPQLGILDLSFNADSLTLESPDPVGRLNFCDLVNFFKEIIRSFLKITWEDLSFNIAKRINLL